MRAARMDGISPRITPVWRWRSPIACVLRAPSPELARGLPVLTRATLLRVVIELRTPFYRELRFVRREIV